MYLRNSSRKMTGIEKQSTANHSVQFSGVIWKTVCYDGKEGGACARKMWVDPCSVHCTWQSHAFLYCVALVSRWGYMQCRTCSLPLNGNGHLFGWLLFLCLAISKKSCWQTLAWWQVETEEYPPTLHAHTHTHTHTMYILWQSQMYRNWILLCHLLWAYHWSATSAELPFLLRAGLVCTS